MSQDTENDAENRANADRIMVDGDVAKRVLGALEAPATTVWPRWPHHHQNSIPIDEQGRFSPIATGEF